MPAKEKVHHRCDHTHAPICMCIFIDCPPTFGTTAKNGNRSFVCLSEQQLEVLRIILKVSILNYGILASKMLYRGANTVAFAHVSRLVDNTRIRQRKLLKDFASSIS